MAGMDLKKLFDTFKMPIDEVLSAYVVGSRLWGTNTPSSDYDLLIILEDPIQQISSHHKTNYDITMISRALFVQRVGDGHLIETMCSLMDHNEAYVWQQRVSMKGLVQNINSLSNWLVEREKVDREKACKMWQKGMRVAGFKILQHTITAELLLRHLQQKACELREGSLTVEEAQAVVRNGRRDEDWAWLSMAWDDVLRAHRERLAEIRKSS